MKKLGKHQKAMLSFVDSNISMYRKYGNEPKIGHKRFSIATDYYTHKIAQSLADRGLILISKIYTQWTVTRINTNTID